MLLLLGWVAGGGGRHLLAMAPEVGPPASLRGKRWKEGKGAAALKEDWWLSCCFSCDPPQACFPVAHCKLFYFHFNCACVLGEDT